MNHDIRIEEHSMLGTKCIVWYLDGERKAAIYIHDDGLRVIHEGDVKVEVLRRTGRDSFEDVTPRERA